MVLCIRSIYRGICGVSGINRRMGKDQEHLGQDKIQQKRKIKGLLAAQENSYAAVFLFSFFHML